MGGLIYIKKRMKNLFIIFFCFCTFYLKAQVGFNNSNPDASSVLDLTSTSKGLLIPRMNSVQRSSITSPATGLLIYNTDKIILEQFNGSVWTTSIIGTINSNVFEVADSVTFTGNVTATKLSVMQELKLPQLTSAQRNAITSPVTGSLIYNTSTNKVQAYITTGWVDLH
jgi:hypothetical protein